MIYGSIPKDAWLNETVVCIASGTSLTDHDVAFVHNMRAQGRCKVIVVNNNYIKAPWADHLHACDRQFFDWHERGSVFRGLTMPMTTLATEFSAEMRRRKVVALRQVHPHGLWMDDTACCATGGNSGYQAVNIAAHYGSKRILLLGYDCQTKTVDNVTKTHWFGSHPSPTDPSAYICYLEYWKTLPAALAAHGLTVINCSRETALTMFPCMPIETAFGEAEDA